VKCRECGEDLSYKDTVMQTGTVFGHIEEGEFQQDGAAEPEGDISCVACGTVVKAEEPENEVCAICSRHPCDLPKSQQKGCFVLDKEKYDKLWQVCPMCGGTKKQPKGSGVYRGDCQRCEGTGRIPREEG
jgi:hypothetical protein